MEQQIERQLRRYAWALAVRDTVRYVVEHPHVLGGDIPNTSSKVIRRAERAGLIEWDPMTLGFFPTMKARVFVGAGLL